MYDDDDDEDDEGWIPLAPFLDVEESVRICRPAAEVWDAIADLGFDARWRATLREVTPAPTGPRAVETTVSEVVRLPGRDYVAETMVTELEPGASYEFMGAGNMGVLAGARSVREDGAGAVVTCLIQLQPGGVSPLLRPFLGRIVRSRLRKDLARLKALLEAGARAG